MCRIAGCVSRTAKPDFQVGLNRMLTAMAHGGPDDEGTYSHDRVWLGHRRLSIIDLSKGGHQPMATQSGEIIISFNGEIYNYLELKRELENTGMEFATKSDTEVILIGYQVWGCKLFDRLEGIFAFALYDQRKNLFFLVRDHLGVKPLYYFMDENELLFSSEVRGFTALQKDWEVNNDWKILFLAFGSIPHPYTTLARVFQLAPGAFIELDLGNFTYQLKHYYRFAITDYVIKSNREALVAMQFASRKSLRKNLIADAPLGIFLSGGIDSSLLTLLADQFSSNVKTISVNFDEAIFDEYPFQKMVLEKTRNVVHITHRVTERMFWEQLEDIWKAMDQPSIDGVNTYFVTRCAKNDGIKAVLSGVGADEIFGGYVSFERIKWMRWFRRMPFKKVIARTASALRKSWGRLVYLGLPGPVGDYLFLRGIFTPDEIAGVLQISNETVWDVLQRIPFDKIEKMTDVEYASFLESNIYLTNQLLKDTDVMGMWNGVEVRAPFLDIELVKKVHTIPPSIRYKKLWPKYLLTASNQNLIPHEIIFREKKGFTFPFDVWIKRNILQFKTLLPAGTEIERIGEEFGNGRCHWSKYWGLAVLQQFDSSSIHE